MTATVPGGQNMVVNVGGQEMSVTVPMGIMPGQAFTFQTQAPMPVAQVSEGSKSVKKVALPRRPRTAHNTTRSDLLFFLRTYLHGAGAASLSARLVQVRVRLEGRRRVERMRQTCTVACECLVKHDVLCNATFVPHPPTHHTHGTRCRRRPGC